MLHSERNIVAGNDLSTAGGLAGLASLGSRDFGLRAFGRKQAACPPVFAGLLYHLRFLN
jgi:hypothetical protein